MRGGPRPGAGGKKPKLPPDEKRKRYQIRFNAEEIQLIKQAAKIAKLGYTTWIRRAAMEAAKQSKSEVEMKKPINTNLTRRELYMAIWKLHPEEVAGATDLEAENDLRGITGNGAYEVKGYCTQKEVKRCSECSLSNYGRDCHNNPIAK